MIKPWRREHEVDHLWDRHFVMCAVVIHNWQLRWGLWIALGYICNPIKHLSPHADVQATNLTKHPFPWYVNNSFNLVFSCFYNKESSYEILNVKKELLLQMVSWLQKKIKFEHHWYKWTDIQSYVSHGIMISWWKAAIIHYNR